MLRLLLIPVVLAAMAAGAVVWSGGDAVGAKADFSFINRGENKSLDPNTMSWLQDIRLAYGLWEGLYTLDPVTLKPILGTADSAEVDPQTHTIWTIHIRPDARWSNGDPVMAKDFLFEWRRMLETPGEYTYLHFYIRGAREYSEKYADYVQAKSDRAATGPPPDISMVGEEALDDHTLRVTLTDPVAFFPALCAFPPFFPMNEKAMQDFAQTDPVTGVTTYSQEFTRPPSLVTNGPYRMAEWSFRRRIRLVANDFYWDRAHVKSRVIDQISADDSLEAYRAYARGDVDWIAEVDNDLAATILSKGGRPDLHVFQAFGTYYYSLNCLPKLPDGRENPLVDARVRRALAMSIDKQPIIDNAARLDQPIAMQYIPPHVFAGYDSPPGLPYDPQAARKLLAEAGYPGGKGFPHLSLLYNPESNHGDVAQMVRRQWLDNLGIEVQLESVEVKIFGARLHSQDYDIARGGWFGDYDDPTTFTDKYKSDSDDNDSKWKNTQYDALCAAAQKETDVTRRLHLLSQAEAILLKEAPIIPLYGYVNAYLVSPQVRGLPFSPNGSVMFKSVEVVH